LTRGMQLLGIDPRRVPEGSSSRPTTTSLYDEENLDSVPLRMPGGLSKYVGAGLERFRVPVEADSHKDRTRDWGEPETVGGPDSCGSPTLCWRRPAPAREESVRRLTPA
jgi:hypothetical protein